MSKRIDPSKVLALCNELGDLVCQLEGLADSDAIVDPRIIVVSDASTGETLAESEQLEELEAEEFYEFAVELARSLSGGRKLRVTMKLVGSFDPRPERTEEIIGTLAASA